jgi:hypothetical protein
LLSRIRYKAIGVIAQFIFIGIFVQYTRSEMSELTGIKVFSPLGGWHIANDALYMYEQIYKEKGEPKVIEFHDLDSTVRYYFDHSAHVSDLLTHDLRGGGAYYLANHGSPLYRYMYWKYGVDTIFQDFRKWGPMGVECEAYGSYLVRQYPLEFARYYIWPNTIRYFSPPTEIFSANSTFFLRPDDLGDIARQFIDVKTLSVDWNLIKLRNILLWWYPILFTCLNALLIVGFGGFCLFGGFKKSDRRYEYIHLLIIFLWVLNFIFSVVAASVVLRYELFIFVVMFVFGLLLADFIHGNEGALNTKLAFNIIG